MKKKFKRRGKGRKRDEFLIFFVRVFCRGEGKIINI